MSHAESPYRRDNFFGGDDTTDDPGPDRDWGPNHHFSEHDVEAVIAHRLLRDTATMLCATTLFEPPYNGGRSAELCAWLFDGEHVEGHGDALHHQNHAQELTDPVLHVPKDADPTFAVHESGQYRHRRRLNPETGYVSGGESTGVVIQDRATDEFLAVVRLWLVGRETDLADWKHDQALQYARRMKRQGQLRDVDIMTHVVRKVRSDDFERDS